MKHFFTLLFLSCSLSAFAEDEAFIQGDAWSLQDAVTKAVSGHKDNNDSVAPRWKRAEWVTVPKFGGYIVGSYKYDSADDDRNEGFGLRFARVYVDGSILRDFNYRVQVDFAGSPRVLDAYLEWARYKFVTVKAGEFKRCFTLENPMNPWDICSGDYSQLSKKLAGFGDRVGESSMGGRDLGAQVAGDLFKSKRDGHYQFRYQFGVYNGQGINQKDLDGKKDWIGTLQYSPVKNLRLAVFGWWGNYVMKGVGSVDRHRWAASVGYEGTNYQAGDFWGRVSFRAEYAQSYGYKFSQGADGAYFINTAAGNKADAWYIMVGAPLWRWIKGSLKWDVYRDDATWDTEHSIYSAALMLQPHKNLMLQLQYNYHHDLTEAVTNYHQFWTQLYVRF